MPDTPTEVIVAQASIVAGAVLLGVLAGSVQGFYRTRRNMRDAKRCADALAARNGLAPDLQKIVRLCVCGHGANYHSGGTAECYEDKSPNQICRCCQFTPHPPLFDELAEPDAFEDREDPSSTIGRV